MLPRLLRKLVPGHYVNLDPKKRHWDLEFTRKWLGIPLAVHAFHCPAYNAEKNQFELTDSYLETLFRIGRTASPLVEYGLGFLQRLSDHTQTEIVWRDIALDPQNPSVKKIISRIGFQPETTARFGQGIVKIISPRKAKAHFSDQEKRVVDAILAKANWMQAKAK